MELRLVVVGAADGIDRRTVGAYGLTKDAGVDEQLQRSVDRGAADMEASASSVSASFGAEKGLREANAASRIFSRSPVHLMPRRLIYVRSTVAAARLSSSPFMPTKIRFYG